MSESLYTKESIERFRQKGEESLEDRVRAFIKANRRNPSGAVVPAELQRLVVGFAKALQRDSERLVEVLKGIVLLNATGAVDIPEIVVEMCNEALTAQEEKGQ